MTGSNAFKRVALAGGAALTVSAIVCTAAAILGWSPMRTPVALSLHSGQPIVGVDPIDDKKTGKTDELFGTSGNSLADAAGVPEMEQFDVDPLVFLAQMEPDEDTETVRNSNESDDGRDSSVLASAAASAGTTTPRVWRGADLDGSLCRLPDDPSVQAIVIVFLSTDCPISNAAIAPLNRLSGEFSSSGVEFYGVISSRTVTRAEAVAHRDQYRIGFPVLFDASGELRNCLRPTHTPEAFVLTSRGRVLYRGRVDDRFTAVGRKRLRAQRHDLREALRQVVAGEPVAVPVTEPIGCLIENPPSTASDGQITYARHIAPVIYSNCVSCHRPGESAPFSLTSFEDVAKRAGQIREVVESGFMPPWRPVPGFGEFRGERYLSESEIELIAQWAQTGTTRGDPADEPHPPKQTSGWRLGPPDAVYTVSEPFDIPADGDDIYQYFVIPSGLTRDRVISAIEFRPGNPQAIHHASFSYDTNGIARKYDAADPRPGYQRFGGPGFLATGTLGGWASGVTPQHLPDGVGRLIRKGADLVVQVHYHPTGKPERDQSKLGLHFADGEVEQLLVELVVADMNLQIPPGAKEYRHDASYILPADVIVHSVAPHMHLLGREMKVTAILPDGPPEGPEVAQIGTDRQSANDDRGWIVPLIWIDDWDFNWQDFYFFREAIHLPRGTRIVVEAKFDNSSANPMNPNSPPILVRWGEQSTDEMCVCFFDVTTPDPEDRERLWNHNRQSIDEQFRSIRWLQNRPSSIGTAGRSSIRR